MSFDVRSQPIHFARWLLVEPRAAANENHMTTTMDETTNHPPGTATRENRKRSSFRKLLSLPGNIAAASASKRRAAGLTVFVASSLLFAAAARAESGGWLEIARGLKPYAALSWNYSSNLFYNPPELNDASDWYLTAEAGFDTELKVSRQRFLLDARIFHNAYDRFSEFDYTGGDGKVLWKWLAGTLWDGELGYQYEQTQRSFANQIVPRKDLRARNKVFGSANRWLSDRWRLGALANWTDTSFTESERLDRTTVGGGGKLEYVSKPENILGIQALYSTADYQRAPDLDYDDWSVGPYVEWRLTTKTRIRGNAAYENRSYDVTAVRNFDGLTGRVTTFWDATAKTNIRADIYRDLSNLADEIASYAIIDGVSVEPRWNITGKTALRASAAYERRDFQGADEADNFLGISERVDDVTSFELGLDWNARRNLLLSLAIGADRRDSNRTLRDYDVQYVEARFSLGL